MLIIRIPTKSQALPGRDPYFNIVTIILRVNRQVSTESVWILYERNVFQMDLSASVSMSSWNRPCPVIHANPTTLSLSYWSRSGKRVCSIPVAFAVCVKSNWSQRVEIYGGSAILVFFHWRFSCPYSEGSIG